MATEQKVNWKERKIGALWKSSGDGKTKFSGRITINGVEERFVVFENGFKDADNKPDYEIYKSVPKEGEQAKTATATAAPKPTVAPAAKPTPVRTAPKAVETVAEENPLL